MIAEIHQNDNDSVCPSNNTYLFHWMIEDWRKINLLPIQSSYLICLSSLASMKTVLSIQHRLCKFLPQSSSCFFSVIYFTIYDNVFGLETVIILYHSEHFISFLCLKVANFSIQICKVVSLVSAIFLSGSRETISVIDFNISFSAWTPHYTNQIRASNHFYHFSFKILRLFVHHFLWKITFFA